MKHERWHWHCIAFMAKTSLKIHSQKGPIEFNTAPEYVMRGILVDMAKTKYAEFGYFIFDHNCWHLFFLSSVCS